jgi:hypothetical protein
MTIPLIIQISISERKRLEEWFQNEIGMTAIERGVYHSKPIDDKFQPYMGID